MTDVYLAYGGSGAAALEQHDWKSEPLSLLVAFPFLKAWKRTGGAMAPQRLMLDSGAWSAYKSGAVIDIDELIREASDPEWTECVGLDVIGDPDGSRSNLDYMRSKGCEKAMPVFHIGEPWELLEYYCSKWDKVGLACSTLVGVSKAKYKFYDQCFAKAWPHKFHSFGWTFPEMLLRYPFHSADSSTWCFAPSKFNRLSQYTGKQISFRGVPGEAIKNVMPGEVSLYAKLQRRLRSRWSKELNRLEEQNA